MSAPPWAKAAPPIIPPPELQPPPVVRVLQVTRSPRERLRWYGYTVGMGAGVLAWPLLWYKLAAAGLSWEYVTCFGVGGWLLLLGGFGLFGLQQGREFANTSLYYQVAKQEVAYRGIVLDALTARVQAHMIRHYGPAPQPYQDAPPTIHHWTEGFGDLFRRAATTVQDAPPPDPQETRRLPELPAPSAYWGSDVETLVDAITSGADYSARKGPLSPERHKAAMTRLVSEGFMIARLGRSAVPSEYWAKMPADQWHDAIARAWGTL